MDGQLAPLAVPIAETQRMLGGISRTSVYEQVKSGQLTKIRIGRRGLITMASIHALVDRLSEAQARDAEDGCRMTQPCTDQLARDRIEDGLADLDTRAGIGEHAEHDEELLST